MIDFGAATRYPLPAFRAGQAMAESGRRRADSR